MKSELLDQFDLEKAIIYRGEVYRVRDNGAVRRQPRGGRRRRPLDAVWSFGRPCRHWGYLLLAGVSVHRIVATAFHGEPPTAGHVVDHIDTNRKNNRTENLRWVTRLENLLLNPVTIRRILMHYESLDAFFADPSRRSVSGQRFAWMRTVSKEEAATCRARLEAWAKQGTVPRGGELGEWLFRPQPRQLATDQGFEGLDANPLASVPQEPMPESDPDQPSLTPLAVQRNWRTPTAFPQCPDAADDKALATYASQLTKGAVFATNKYGSSVTLEARVHDDLLAVVSETEQKCAIKPWAVARVTLENGQFVHAGHQYFTLEGAMNEQADLLGEPRPHEPTIDDYS